jgi:hypothetical protein
VRTVRTFAAILDGTPGAVYTRGIDIDNRGRIVGDYGTRS